MKLEPSTEKARDRWATCDVHSDSQAAGLAAGLGLGNRQLQGKRQALGASTIYKQSMKKHFQPIQTVKTNLDNTQAKVWVMKGGWKWERQRKGQDPFLPLGGKNTMPSKACGTRYRGLRIGYCLMPHRYSGKTYKNNRIIIKRTWEETWRGRGEYVLYPHLLWSWWSDPCCMSDLTS